MQTECSADLFGFARVEGRRVAAAFDGGTMTSEAGAMLLGATDGQIRLIERFAGCFTDYRAAELIEHTVPSLVGQRVFGIALGYEDLLDHDQLRHDPVMAVLGGKLAPRRADCAPLAGKSTLNRLELSRPEPTRYHKISYDAAAIEGLFVELFLDAHRVPPPQITLDLDATDDPLHGHQEDRFFHGYYDTYCYLPLYVFCGRHLLASKLRPANIDASAVVKELIGQKVEGHFILLNWNDPEQAQFYMSIAGTCIKLNVVCKLYPARAPYPALFPPPGLLSFAFDDADQTFINAFKAAGLITDRVGTSVGEMMFPAGIREGILIGPKPSPLGSEAWRTNAPPP
jgi:hypothetical protein